MGNCGRKLTSAFRFPPSPRLLEFRLPEPCNCQSTVTVSDLSRCEADTHAQTKPPRRARSAPCASRRTRRVPSARPPRTRPSRPTARRTPPASRPARRRSPDRAHRPARARPADPRPGRRTGGPGCAAPGSRHRPEAPSPPRQPVPGFADDAAAGHVGRSCHGFFHGKIISGGFSFSTLRKPAGCGG